MAKKNPKPKPTSHYVCMACSLGKCTWCLSPRCYCRRNGHWGTSR